MFFASQNDSSLVVKHLITSSQNFTYFLWMPYTEKAFACYALVRLKYNRQHLACWINEARGMISTHSAVNQMIFACDVVTVIKFHVIVKTFLVLLQRECLQEKFDGVVNRCQKEPNASHICCIVFRKKGRTDASAFSLIENAIWKRRINLLFMPSCSSTFCCWSVYDTKMFIPFFVPFL